MNNNASEFKKLLDKSGIYGDFHDSVNSTICFTISPLKNGIDIKFFIEFFKDEKLITMRTNAIINSISSTKKQEFYRYINKTNINCEPLKIKFVVEHGNLIVTSNYDINKESCRSFNPEEIVVRMQSILRVINKEYEQMEKYTKNILDFHNELLINNLVENLYNDEENYEDDDDGKYELDAIIEESGYNNIEEYEQAMQDKFDEENEINYGI